MENIITHSIQIRPRYNEVDPMGYVYHGNYIAFFHQARTELMRQYGLEDSIIEKQGIMMPVTEAQVKYHQPSFYDENLTIKVSLSEIKPFRLFFTFKVYNNKGKLNTSGKTTVVFVDAETRKPMKVPAFVIGKLKMVEVG
jgi:acyl-CoA thioester hydrolase